MTKFLKNILRYLWVGFLVTWLVILSFIAVFSYFFLKLFTGLDKLLSEIGGLLIEHIANLLGIKKRKGNIIIVDKRPELQSEKL